MAIGIRIQLKGLQETVAKLNVLAQMGADAGGSKTELHRRYGIQAMKWIDENFKTEGGLLEDGKWEELSDNTVAARRKGSRLILQDTGTLRPSFGYQATSTEVRIGSPSKLALFHNEGTRGPYEIAPKNKLALAFVVAEGGRKVTRKLAQQSARFGTGHLRVNQGAIVVKSVIHPGLSPRRMLPNENELLPRLVKTTENWLLQLGVGGTVSSEDA